MTFIVLALVVVIVGTAGSGVSGMTVEAEARVGLL